MNDDAVLLRRYVEERSEAAFAELVQRRLDLVYGAALRRTGGDAHRAADVAQQVFATLASQARTLIRHPVLSAWLHTATRNAALNLMISEQRRRTRERAAMDPVLVENQAPPVWENLRPVLDAAIDELPESDRTAIVLRFLEHRAFADIGAALRISADAARMRTDRALGKLRGALARRGITSTVAAMGAALSSQPLVSAPAGLAATIASSVATGAAAGASLASISLATLMNLKTILTGTAVLTAFGAGAYVGLTRNLETPLPPPAEMPQPTQTIAALRQENLSLRTQLNQLKAENARLAAPPPAPPPAAPRAASAAPTASAAQVAHQIEIAGKQRAMLNNLRQLSSALTQYQLEHGGPPASLEDIVGEMKYIRRLVPADGEDYSSLPLSSKSPLTLVSPGGVTVTFDPVGTQTTQPVQPPPPSAAVMALQQRLQPAMERALAAYKAANDGKGPPQSETGGTALLPYFSTPQEGADFVEYMEALKASGHLPK